MLLKNENLKISILIFIAFIFSVSVRFIWVEQNKSQESFKFNNEFMLNTNDSYYWAEGARDILASSININHNSPVDKALAQITAILTKILPFSIETIMFYMPAFFASLIVIPLILIGKKINSLEAGFISALLASIAWSYYNRTMLGYYDTDLLNIVFPTFLVWSLVWAIETKQLRYILITSYEIIAYRWWYPQSYSIEFAFFSLVVLYVLYLVFLKKDYKYHLILASFILLSMINIDGLYRFIFVTGLFSFIFIKKEIFYKYLNLIFLIIICAFFLTGGFDPIWGKLKSYVFKDLISKSLYDSIGLHFFTVMQTISEAEKVSFETFANRISGSIYIFIFALIGYGYLLFKHRVLIFSLPMVGLGFLALFGGLRFTIYAVPFLALGTAYFIVVISDYSVSKLNNQKVKDFIRSIFIYTLGFVVLIPNLNHVKEYKVKTVVNSEEALVLNELKGISNRNDYVLSWWDYGYPIRYFADVKTLIDGGKHSGSDNFTVAYSLISPQKKSYNMAKLDVFYTEKFLNMKEERKKFPPTNIENMIIDYGYKDSNIFLDNLDKIEILHKTEDIYFYLPSHILDIFSTITKFVNLDLMTGKEQKNSFIYSPRVYVDFNDKLYLGNDFVVNLKDMNILIGENKFELNSFITTKKVGNKVELIKKSFNDNSNIIVIYMENIDRYIVVDSKMLESTFVELFVFEKYDNKLFEPIIIKDHTKVYKLKQ